MRTACCRSERTAVMMTAGLLQLCKRGVGGAAAVHGLGAVAVVPTAPLRTVQVSVSLLVLACVLAWMPVSDAESSVRSPDVALLRAVQRAAASAPVADSVPLGERLARVAPHARSVHRQVYVPLASKWRRNQAADGPSPTTGELNIATTAPLQIHTDFSQLFEHTAVKYSVCWRVGDWFRWNFAALPPGTGDTCNRLQDPAGQNCWGRCEEQDVLTPVMRDWMIQKIRIAVNETQAYFRVRRRLAPLTFATTRGEYWRLYEELGEPTAPSCAKDAALMYRLPINESYCAAGVDADAVFFPTMAQQVPGVAGWGTDVIRDQTGRPVFLLMGWSVPQTEILRLEQERTDAWRRTIIHELIHGLGFSIQQFGEVAIRTNGNTHIVELRQMTDVDGSRDEVWVATGARTLEIARQYYNCSTLSGLPLMGENPLGDGSRGSHWETRLLADDIMAYGDGGVVSAFTLAMLEDTGYYLADYSKAGCVAWGRAQGCEFVQTRCGARRDDLSVMMPQELCAREHPTDTRCTAWESSGEAGEQQRLCWSPNSFLTSHCDDPHCSRGWGGTGNSNNAPEVELYRCNAECVSDVVTAAAWQLEKETAATANATLANVTATRPRQACGLNIPPAVVQAMLGADDIDMSGLIASGAISATIVAAKEFVLVTAFVLIFACAASCCNCCRKRFKPSTIRAVHIALNSSFTLSGMAGAATAAYTIYFDRKYEDLFSVDAARVVMYCALFTAAFSGIGCLGALRRSRCVLGLFLLALLLVVITQISLALTVAWWLETAYASEPTHAADTSRVETGDPAVDAYVNTAFSELEGYGCHLYRTCCMRSELFSEANGTHTCTAAHNGATVGAAAALRHDPSGPQFCRVLTGSAVASRAPPAFAQCLALQQAGVVVLDECVNRFCVAGIEGYQRFMGSLLAWLRKQAGWLVIGFSVLIALLMCSMVLTFIMLFFPGKPEQSDRTELLRSGDGAAEDSGNIELSELIDIRTESVADTQLSEERAKFKRKIQQQLASLEHP